MTKEGIKQVPTDDIDAFMVATWCDGLLDMDGVIHLRTVDGNGRAKPGEWIKYVGRVDGVHAYQVVATNEGESK